MNYADPTGMMGERVGGPGEPIHEIEEVVIKVKRRSLISGDPRKVQVYQYNVVRSANGWDVHRNSQLDKTVTRIEGKNWRGAEERHFSVLNNGKWKNYESYEDFSKDYPEHNLKGMSAKELAKLSWKSTKEVAKEAWTNPESQAVLLVPFEAFAFAKLEKIVSLGKVLDKAGARSRAVNGVLRSFDDVVANPKALWGKSADEVGSMLGDGWTKGAYGSSKTGWKFTRSTDGQSIFYHPGGGRHGGSYYGFSSGTLGKKKIVGPDYIPLKGDKATIINIGN